MTVACELELERHGRHGRRASGRLEDGLARLLVPRPDGLEEIAVSVDLLPDAFARLVGLGPRPGLEPAVRLRYQPAELARLIAEQTVKATSDAFGGPISGEGDRNPLATLRSHWRIEARRSPSIDPPDVREVEVLDTEDTLWLVSHPSAEVELRSTTSTEVFRLRAALAGRPEDLRAAPAPADQ